MEKQLIKVDPLALLRKRLTTESHLFVGNATMEANDFFMLFAQPIDESLFKQKNIVPVLEHLSSWYPNVIPPLLNDKSSENRFTALCYDKNGVSHVIGHHDNSKNTVWAFIKVYDPTLLSADPQPIVHRPAYFTVNTGNDAELGEMGRTISDDDTEILFDSKGNGCPLIDALMVTHGNGFKKAWIAHFDPAHDGGACDNTLKIIKKKMEL